MIWHFIDISLFKFKIRINVFFFQFGWAKETKQRALLCFYHENIEIHHAISRWSMYYILCICIGAALLMPIPYAAQWNWLQTQYSFCLQMFKHCTMNIQQIFARFGVLFFTTWYIYSNVTFVMFGNWRNLQTNLQNCLNINSKITHSICALYWKQKPK